MVTAVGRRLDPRPGRRGGRRRRAAGASPGSGTSTCTSAQWTLASQRLDLAPARSPEDALRAGGRAGHRRCPDLPVIGWGHRSGGWDREVTVSELDAVTGDTPVVLISGDGHHAWLNTTALMHLAMPVRDSVVRETEWFAVYPRLVTPGRQRRHLAGGLPPHPRRRPRRGASSGMVDFEFGGSRERLGRAVGSRAATCCGSAGRRTPTHLDDVHRRRAAHRRPAARLRRARDDGAAQDHQRRLAQHPHRLVLRAVRRRAPARVPRRSAQPLRRRAARAARAARTPAGLEVATHAIGDAAVAEALAAYADTGARGSIEHAQMVGRDDVRRMAELGVRASVQPAHLLDDRDLTEQIWREPRRALLRLPLDARRRRRARARLRRPGLAARPVAGDRRRRAPQRRRPRPVARRAGAHRRARRWPPPSTASRPSASARAATWSCSTATRSPSARDSAATGHALRAHGGRADHRRRPGRALDALVDRALIRLASATRSATACCSSANGCSASAGRSRSSRPRPRPSSPAQMSWPSLGPSRST